MLFLPYLNGHQRFEDYSKQCERTEIFPNFRKRSLFFKGFQAFIFCPCNKKSMIMKTSTEQWWKEWKLNKKLQWLRGYCNFYSVSPSRVQFLARMPRAVTFSQLSSSPRNSWCSTSIHAVNTSSHMSIIVQQDVTIYSLLYFCKLLYMFQMVIPPIIRSTYNCNYSIWHWSNRLSYLPLWWRSWNAVPSSPP
jgi:hypothetical protein